MICRASDCRYYNEDYPTHCKVEDEYHEDVEIEWELIGDSAPSCSDFMEA